MIKLLLEFIKIGTFTYGGGLAMIPLLRDIAINNHWLSDGQFADLIAISQSTPGPIAINMATFIGFKEQGILGAIFASIVLIVPAFIMAIVLSKFLTKYRKHPAVTAAFVGLKATVIGLIATSIFQVGVVSIFEKAPSDLASLWCLLDIKAVVMLLAAYFIIRKTQKHPLYYIVGFGVISIFIW
ncbi:chromate transporter [Fusibacter bizertensis]